MRIIEPNAGRAAATSVRADQAVNGLPSPLQKDTAHWSLQLAIVALTVPGMWLITGVGADARYGYVVLIAAQPFWLLAHWRERQWGMFAIALVFTALWLRGIFNHFPY